MLAAATSEEWRKEENKKSRGDPTRTGDHLVPNQVRYQLRYTPNFIAMSYVVRKAVQRYNI